MTDLAQGSWYNPPERWSLEAGVLRVVTDARTDFWRKTFYGFIRDNGHFLGLTVRGPFTAQVHVQGRFEALYDQAGLMLRRDDRFWLKAGVEFTDGALHLSTVVTRQESDWSVAAFDGRDQAFWLRLTYAAGSVRVQASVDGVRWPLLRLAPFPEAEELSVGPMCCTPERAGLEVEFSDFQLGPALATELHDLS